MIAVLLGSVLPHLNPLFTPVTPAMRLQNSGELVRRLELCLAIAYFALWRAAPDFPVFRILSLFFVILGAEQLAQYSGADPIDWSLRASAVGVLPETAAQAMNIQSRRWTRVLGPSISWASSARGFRRWSGGATSASCLRFPWRSSSTLDFAAAIPGIDSLPPRSLFISWCGSLYLPASRDSPAFRVL